MKFLTKLNVLKKEPHLIPVMLLVVVITLPMLGLIPWVSRVSFYRGHVFLRDKSSMPTLTWQGIFSGAWQKKCEAWLNDNFLFHRKYAAVSNQIYYSIFSKTYGLEPQLIVGKKHYLFEKLYIDAYMNAYLDNSVRPQVNDWLQDLQALANFFAQRGQQFIYLITPSKVAYYPEYLPSQYTKMIQNPRLDYMAKVNALKHTNIRYFDASQFVLAAKSKDYGKYLFPEGGTHWTMLAAGFSAQQLLGLMHQKDGSSLPKLNFSYNMDTISSKINEVDRDLLKLSNVFFSHTSSKTMRVTFEKTRNPVPLKVAMIGGSFTRFFDELFQETHYFSQLDQYDYLILSHYQISHEGQRIEIPIYRGDIHSYQAILDADVVILEENEMFLYSNHFKELASQLLGTATVA